MRRLSAGIIISIFIVAPALACGPRLAPQIPPLAAALDAELPYAKLAGEEFKALKALRSAITELVADNKIPQAREAEERAMKILGYQKELLWCGSGSFRWEKVQSER